MPELKFHKYSEEKPSENGTYLVIFEWRGCEILGDTGVYRDYEVSYYENGRFDEFQSNDGIIEWMKLPELE